MRVAFDSSHVTGDFSTGDISVRIRRYDDARGSSRATTIRFEVPPDFHTHNDSVAAALMTLVGRSCPVVSFNFPISARCADVLRLHYHLEAVGPVDPGLEPRRPGRYLGLMLSGGTDSMAVWQVLTRVLGDDFKIITTDFGRGFSFEARGYEQFRRDVTCLTDFRRKGFAGQGRFTAAVPLLFADYADLAAVTTGHHYTHAPLSIESLRDGGRPRFLDHDRPLHAGGLDEVHIVRGLNTTALLMLALLAEPDILEACWHGSTPPGTSKHFQKGLIFQFLYQRRNLSFPDWLRTIVPPRHQEGFASYAGVRFTSIYLVRHFGLDAARQEFSDIDQYDLSFADTMQLTFMERYDTNLIELIPPAMRAGVLTAFHEAGILPYTELDWAELDQLRAFCLACRGELA